MKLRWMDHEGSQRWRASAGRRPSWDSPLWLLCDAPDQQHAARQPFISEEGRGIMTGGHYPHTPDRAEQAGSG